MSTMGPSSAQPAQLAAALDHHRAGRLREAEQLYKQILLADANDVQSLQLLGTLALQQGNCTAAIEFLSRALAVHPDNAEARINLGLALAGSGKPAEAIAQYRAALEVNPNQALAYNHMGLALRTIGKGEEALAAHRQAVALAPEDANMRYNLGLILERQRQFDEAIEAYDRALALRPKFVEAMHNRGTALTARAGPGDTQAAIAAFEQVLAWRPDYVAALGNYGIALADAGRLDEAIATGRRALAIGPATPAMHWHLGLATLKSGDLPKGFCEYEWRWHMTDMHALPRPFGQPHWDGSELGSRRLLVYGEQGVGDTLQFVRYVPMLADFGGQIILECQENLVRLLAGLAGVHRIATPGRPLPEFDVHCPLMTLPLLFGTTLETIPAQVPYVQAAPVLVEKWRERLGHISGLKVGINWAGNPHFINDRRRSTQLATFAPLAAVARKRGMTLVSLRKGSVPSSEGALANAAGGFDLVDFTAELNDMADTAALMANLDLVISTDTAVPHLAGALAEPVWVLLSTTSDWRWFADRPDSPWYPTMRLFRQDQPGDWSAPVARMAEALREFEPGSAR